MTNHHKTKYISLTAIIGATSILLGSHSYALDPARSSEASVQNDNSAKNARDADGQTLTPLDQSNDAADINITAAIRKELVGSNDFSTIAQNIKIITTKDHRVTLRGPVRSRAEAQSIERIAKAAAGDYKVVNQLEIKPAA